MSQYHKLCWREELKTLTSFTVTIKWLSTSLCNPKLHSEIESFVLFPLAAQLLEMFLLTNTTYTRLNLTFTIPKCLKYRNKGKDHNSQTWQYFIKFLKYGPILLLICFKNFIKYCCVDCCDPFLYLHPHVLTSSRQASLWPALLHSHVGWVYIRH